MITISDEQLYSLSIGGNVTYKPGRKLIKITTDPELKDWAVFAEELKTSAV